MPNLYRAVFILIDGNALRLILRHVRRFRKISIENNVIK